MFIWRGVGLAVVALTFGALVLTEVGVERLFSDDHYYQAHGWPKFVAFVLAAGMVWLLSDYIEKRQARVVVDKQTGQEMTLRGTHHLFFVPLKYWPAILVVAGLVIMFVA
jgi:hypothetical protein